MNTKIMEYCIDLAEMKNFTRVAEKHFISQQGLSFHVKNLEKELGVSLFVRTRHSVEITPAGEAFVAEAQKAIRYTHSACEIVKRLGQAVDNTLSLGCAGVMAKNKATVILQQFMARYSQVSVNLQHGFYDNIIYDFFQNGKFDLIITRRLKSIDRKIFDWRECHTGPIRAVFGKEHSLAKVDFVTREELMRTPYIALFPKEGITKLDDQKELVFQILGGSPNDIVEADGVNTADMMVACGMGYILLNEDLRQEYQANQFAYVPIKDITEGFPVWCIWRRNSSNPELANFLDICKSLDDVVNK